MTTIANTLSPAELLTTFVKRLPDFPVPTEEPTMIYNYTKLMVILQGREVAVLEPDEAIVTYAHSLATKFSDITKDIIVKKITVDQFDSQYDQLHRTIENELSGPIYLLAKQWGLSVKALFCYKNNQFEKAIDLSLECVILNEYLIRKGIYTLLFRSLEQNKNIVRVLFKQHKITEACKLTRDMFSFLYSCAGEGLYGTIFSEETYRDRVPYVREGYAYEFFRSIVSLIIFLEKNQGLGERVFREIFSTFTIDITTPDRQIITDWIAIKKKFYEKDFYGFFEMLNDFFEMPLCKIYDVIKISLLLDVCTLVDEDSKGVILAYIDQYLNGQFYLKTDLSSRNLVVLSN